MSAPDVNDLIGLPYRRGARGPASYDCWGLVLELAWRCGRAIPADWCSRGMTRSEQRALMAGVAGVRTIRLDAPVEGAIAYSERGAHCGYVLHGRVVHAMRGAGVVAWTPGLWTAHFHDGAWHAWLG